MENLLPIKSKWLNKILHTPIVLTIISFTIGTVFLGLHLVDTTSLSIVIIGFYYVLLAIVVNLLFLLALIVLSFIYRKHQKEILMRTAWILINIPIVIIYMFIIFGL